MGEATLDTFDSENLHLPVQYDSKRLRLIFDRKYSHWNEYIYLPTIRAAHKTKSSQWLKECFRLSTTNHLVSQSSLTNQGIIDPKERIKRRLKLYESPSYPPQIEKSAPPLRMMRIIEYKLIAASIKQEFVIVRDFTKIIAKAKHDMKKLNMDFIVLTGRRFDNVHHKVNIEKSCSGKSCRDISVSVNVRLIILKK